MPMMSETDPAVFTERMNRAQHQMAREGIGWLMLGASPDLRYLTGYNAHASERLNLLILPVGGPPLLVAPQLEAPIARSSPTGSSINVHEWQDHESPYDLVASLIGDVSGTSIAVGDYLRSGFLLALQQQLHPDSWSSAEPIMKPLRTVKDEREIELLAEAARLTDEAWHEFIDGPAISGLSEMQAMERLMGLMTKRGLVTSFGLCASGPNSASPHHSAGTRVIEQGDVVIFDWGGSIEGYHSDVTRTVVVGEPTDEYRKVHQIVLDANEQTFAAVRPGLPCEELDRVARDLISRAGYGEQFLHRVGHGLGLDVHEDPYLVRGNSTPLEPGMVFSDEPGIYLEGNFGVRIEDTVVCTQDGGIKLNHATRDVTVMD